MHEALSSNPIWPNKKENANCKCIFTYICHTFSTKNKIASGESLGAKVMYILKSFDILP
jgi:hypothetical protein